MQRRGFLAGLASTFAVACTPLSEQEAVSDAVDPGPTTGDVPAPTTSITPPLVSTATTRPDFTPQVPNAPFGFGVASGDPTSHSVTLWTRLADLDGFPVSAGDQTIGWSVALDPAMVNIVDAGDSTATVDNGHSLHVSVAELAPDTTYYFRFAHESGESIVGRTWTMPSTDLPRPIRIAALSCQQYEEGFYGAYDGFADDEPDLVVHLGDYVYERRGSAPTVRSQSVESPSDIAGMRSLWSTARLDSSLMAAHGSRPWVMMWDDHEIAGNHAGRVTDERGDAAYQAWWEFQPMSAARPEPDVPFVTHRMVNLGVARLWLLDTRQYRSALVCEPLPDLPGIDRCEAVDEPSRTMLGLDQEQWLYDGINADDGQWDIVAQQTVMADLSISLAGAVAINNDQWDGYPQARTRLLDAFAGHERAFVLSGDLHAAMLNTVEGGTVEGGTVLPEVVAPSVTTRMSNTIAIGLSLALLGKSHIHLFDPNLHGYVILDIDPLGTLVRFRQADPRDRHPDVVEGPSYEIIAGTSTPRRR